MVSFVPFTPIIISIVEGMDVRKSWTVTPAKGDRDKGFVVENERYVSIPVADLKLVVLDDP